MIRTQPLFEGPLDIVGDVHGELQGLERLLARLGYDAEGRHPSRRLVFVGDLVDRGPDSVGVVERVSAWVEAGRAQCVLGNHELNILLGLPKDGNGWFCEDWDAFGRDPERRWRYPWKRTATGRDQERCRAFFGRLPLSLERDDLRVAHAAWHAPSLEALGEVDDAAAAARLWQRTLSARNRGGLTSQQAKALLVKHRLRTPLEQRGSVPPMLPELAEQETYHQVHNPVKVITSGLEGIPESRVPFWASGRWRMVERTRWWRDYHDAVPVVFGHYWRVPDTGVDDPADPFRGTAPTDWLGPSRTAFCEDYSVGRRYRDRRAGLGPGAYRGALAALRTPAEPGAPWVVVFDERDPWTLEPPGRVGPPS
jgi:hypothetical protein